MKSSEKIYQDDFQDVVNPDLHKPMDMSAIIERKDRFQKGRSKALIVVFTMAIGFSTLFISPLTGNVESAYLWGGRLVLGVAIAWYLFIIFMMSGLFNELDEEGVEELNDIAKDRREFKNILDGIRAKNRPIFYFEYQAIMEMHLLKK